MDAVAQVARAVLYEGYLLWPYRASALKNTRRWTLGGVYPQRVRRAPGDPSLMRTQVLVEAGPADTVDVRVCFLHAVTLEVAPPRRRRARAGPRAHRRRAAAPAPGGGDRAGVAAVTGLDLAELPGGPAVLDIDIPAGGTSSG